MKLFDHNIPDFLESGERARLLPVAKDSNKEQKVTSSLLASIMAVNEFGRGLLTDVGAPAFKRSRISCYTEVVFKGNGDKKIRPDGLIVVESGKRRWSALVEAKVGNNPLMKDQIEEYLDLAKEQNIDALITISNQFVSVQTHHPVEVAKIKVRKVSLYHWSWMRIMTNAILLATNKDVSDPDQAFILEELIRYLQHDHSGVLSFNKMDSSWKGVCSANHQNTPLRKHAPEVECAVSNWHQLTRFLALQMSIAVGEAVNAYLTKVQLSDAKRHLDDDTSTLVENGKLHSEFSIAHAASRLKLSADFKRRTLCVSMKLDAPKDRQQVKSRLNWLIKQLLKCEDDEVIIRIIWQGRSPDTSATLQELRGDDFDYTPPKPKTLPNAFEIIRVHDLAGRFSAPKVFVDEAQKVLPDFYETAGQYLRVWKAPPPKLKTTQPEAVLEGDG